MSGRLAFAAVVFAVAGGLAYAQQSVTVVGPITPGDCAAFNSTTVIKDAGVNCASGGGGTGTVTSVALSLPNLVFSISGSPVVNNGTLTGSFVNQPGHSALMGANSGALGPPTFRAISSADLPLPTTQTPGVVLVGGPVTSSYVFAVTTSGGVLLRQPSFGELAGIIAPAQMPVATNSTFGVVETVSQQASNWVNGWIGGVPQISQPQFPDIAGSIASSQLPSSGNNTVISNITGATAPPSPNSLSAVLDSAFSAAQGSVLYRGPSTWLALAPGISGQVFTTSGANNNPLWTTVSGTGTMTQIFAGAQIQFSTTPCTTSCVVAVASAANNTVLANTSGGSAVPSPTSPSVILDVFSSAQGSILTRNATIWGALAPGTAGQYLKTNGGGATPAWTSIKQAGAGASFQGAPSNPSNFTNTSALMSGLGATCTITPTLTGRVKFTIVFSVSNSSITNQSFEQYYGTGTAPSQGAAVTGTALTGKTFTATAAVATGIENVTLTGVATGLSTSTAYWFDVSELVAGGTGTWNAVSCDAFEY